MDVSSFSKDTILHFCDKFFLSEYFFNLCKMKFKDEIQIPASKSITNRLLIINYLYPNLKLNNISSAKDSVVLERALNTLLKDENQQISINIGHAGTAMRFLTALCAIQVGKTIVLDGSERMRQRPIKILVDALNDLGADITYLKEIGFPPIKINGKKLKNNSISINSSTSSQYISALMLIAPKLQNGLHINLTGEPVSMPYIEMTISLLKSLGIQVEKYDKGFKIFSINQIDDKFIEIEGDWSSASYLFGISAVLQQPFVLKNFIKNSFQGDSKIVDYFTELGIETNFLQDNKILLKPISNFIKPKLIELNLLETPDLAQTLATTCLALKIPCKLTGLQTLKIKETDRLQALKNEIEKFNVPVKITGSSIEFDDFSNFNTSNISIKTYDDHRMAMSFAILKAKYPEITIENPDVVVKSFPYFWELFY